MKRRCAGGVVVAALAAGCGGSDPGATAPAPVPAVAQITIDTPRDGQELRAKAGGEDALSRRTRVRGRAPAGSIVYLSAACRPRPCSARATAGDDGRWSASLTLKAPRSAGFVTLDATARERVVTGGSAVSTVQLVGASGTASAGREAPRGSSSSRARARQAPADPSPPDPGTPAPRDPRPSSPRAVALPRDVLVIGDSLAAGTAEALPAALPGWRVRTDARIGRPLAEGMRILGAEGDAPAVLAFSLFTNDDPRNTAALEAAVRSTAARQGGCAVWATVVRPPLNGVSYEAANALLRRLAGDPELARRLRVVDWSAEAAQSRSLMAGDGVHATPEGYRARAQMFARAIRDCAGG